MTVQRYGTSCAEREGGLFVKSTDYDALEAKAKKLRDETLMLGYELAGVIADVEHGNGFDRICLETIKRVRAKLDDAAWGAK